MDEINRLIVSIYPEPTVYIDLVPKDFDRPSFLLQLIRVTQEPANAKTLTERAYYTITCFGSTDVYHHSNSVELLEIQQNIMNLFRSGYLQMENRAVEVKASNGGRDFDKAYVDLQFEYNEIRGKETELPKMKEVLVAVEEE